MDLPRTSMRVRVPGRETDFHSLYDINVWTGPSVSESRPTTCPPSTTIFFLIRIPSDLHGVYSCIVECHALTEERPIVSFLILKSVYIIILSELNKYS